MNADILLCIFGMCLATLIPRVVPITLLAGRKLPPLLVRWLSFVPVSVLAALVMPDLTLVNGKLDLSFDNLFFYCLSSYAGRVLVQKGKPFQRPCCGHGNGGAYPLLDGLIKVSL